MKTDLLSQTDAYVREFDATVLDVRDNRLALDRTAFYPGGGGQPRDRGAVRVGDRLLDVTKVKRDGDLVWHSLALTAADEPIAVGTGVHGILDWDWRYPLMRTHTALHILCGIVWRDYGASVTGGSMKPLEGRMDFEFERMQADLVHEIEAKVNEEVEAARDIVVRSLPRKEAFEIPDLIRTKINLLPAGIEEVRTVEIVGLDLQADGGTHVANTREVGPIRVLDYKSKGRINKRILIGLA